MIRQKQLKIDLWIICLKLSDLTKKQNKDKESLEEVIKAQVLIWISSQKFALR